MYREEDIGKRRELRSEIIRIMNSPIWEKEKKETEGKDKKRNPEKKSGAGLDEDYGMGNSTSWIDVKDEKDEKGDSGSVLFERELYRDSIVKIAAKWLEEGGIYKKPWVRERFDHALHDALNSYNPEYRRINESNEEITAQSFYDYFSTKLKRALTAQNVIENTGSFLRIIRNTTAYEYDDKKEEYIPCRDRDGNIVKISKSRDEHDVYQIFGEREDFYKIARTYRGQNRYGKPVNFEDIFLKEGNIEIIQSNTEIIRIDGNKFVSIPLKKGEIYDVIWMLKDNGKWWYVLKDQKGWVEADRCQYNGNVIYMGETINQFIKSGKEYTVTYDYEKPEKEMNGEMIIDLLHDPSGLWDDKWVSAEDITIDKGRAIVIDDKVAENFQIGDIVEVTDQIYRDGLYYYTAVAGDGTKSDVRADQVEFIEGKLFIEKTDVMLYAPQKEGEILGEGKETHRSLGSYTINGKK